MLLFIGLAIIVFPSKINSNTSHVIVYRGFVIPIAANLQFKYISCYCLSGSPLLNAWESTIQIHLMLLFIELEKMDNGSVKRFKYISCYCLSPSRSPCPVYHLRFKYISCYCLSGSAPAGSLRNYSFKYISCYCLSPKPVSFGLCSRIQIHLMLLFIPNAFWFSRVLSYSNTSHVIVYQICTARSVR